jgi:hypothetical protein
MATCTTAQTYRILGEAEYTENKQDLKRKNEKGSFVNKKIYQHL